ncbi:MAG: hypothetical protein C5B59_02780 [Bacteroidetes bacterium]|nr:MAG: hypothetical protein C5B59_02780 [Bacteroidota bacterium]
MIPLILVWLLRRYKISRRPPALKFAYAFCFSLLWALSLSAQKKTIHYTVYHNGSEQGTLRLYENVESNIVRIRIESDVKMRILVMISVQTIEEAIFEKGILVSSYLSRIVNGNEKVKQQVQATGFSYQLKERSGTSQLPYYPIRASILWLYYTEPVGLREVFSDNFQKYVPVEKVDSCRYRVKFPNGHENYYTYHNGVCTKVEVDQSLFHLDFVLNE